MMHRIILFLILGVDVLILFYQTAHLSISYEEASILYGNFSFLQLLIQVSINFFGQNDFSLRFIMIVLHFASAILIYLISRRYIAKERDRLWLLLIFVLLPGVVSSAIVVNSAGLLIFGVLLFIYLSDKVSQKTLNALLLFFALIDVGFAYLFVGLMFFYLAQKKYKLLVYMIGLYLITTFLYGFGISGAPKGHFLDTIGVYSAVFSPIIFIYIFYTLYRRYFTSKRDIVWYISTIALLFSLILSFRQQISIEYFAPYLIVALPLAAQSFISSYRVRLKIHRKKYKYAFVFSFIFLIFNTLVVLFNKELYLIVENPKKQFVYNMHVAKELAYELKKRNIHCVVTDKKMQIRLQFYEIEKCNSTILDEKELTATKATDVTISYKDRVVYRANVTNINNI